MTRERDGSPACTAPSGGCWPLCFYVLLGIGLGRSRLVATGSDRFLGDLSHPVFLCHWIVASLVALLVFDARHPGGGALFWSALLFVNGAAAAIHLAIEWPVERLRDRVRPRERQA